MANKIQFKKGLKSKLPVLSLGEPGFCTDTNELFVGGSSGNVEMATKSQLNQMATKLEIPIPLDTGYQLGDPGYTNKIVKDGLKQAVIYGAVSKTDGSDFIARGDAYKIATLPVGFVPKFNVNNSSSVSISGLEFEAASSVTLFGGGLYVYIPINCKRVAFQIAYETQ